MCTDKLEPYIIIDGNDEKVAIRNEEYWREIKKEKYNLLLKKSKIPENYSDIEFSDYIGDKSRESLTKVIKYAKNCLDENFHNINLFLTGENSCQKCVTKDTIVYDESGFSYIDEFSDGNNGYFEKEIKLLSDKNYNNTSHFFEEDVNETVKIVTSTGNTLQGTLEHPIYIIDNEGNFLFKSLGEIKENDYVVTYKNTNHFGENKLINFKFVPKKGDYISKRHFNLPERLTPALSRFLGYFIANGSYGGNSLNLSSKNELIRKDINSILNTFGLSIGKIYDNLDFQIHSIFFKQFINFLICKNNFDTKTARYKQVPYFVLKADRENQIQFLKGLFECDSYYSKTNKSFGYFTASEQLVREVQLLLLNLGIISHIIKSYKKEYDHTYYELWMYGKNCNHLFSIIMVNSLKYPFYEKSFNNKNSKLIIPYIFDYIKSMCLEVRNYLNVSKNGCFTYNNNLYRFKLGKVLNYPGNNLTYSKLMEIKDLFNYLLTEYKDIDFFVLKVNEFFKKFKHIFNEDIFYDKVIKKTIIKEKIKVYDVTVPSNHMFLANGIMNHNTMLMCNIGKEFIKSGLSVRFIQAGDLIDLLLKSQGFSYIKDIEDKIKDYTNVDLILIDDIFDKKKSTFWNNSPDLIITAWDKFIRKQISEDKRIIMTSNFSVDYIKEHFGESMCNLIHREFYQLYFYDSIVMERRDRFEGLFD